MTPARLRVGLAGLGAMGRNHLRVLGARDDVTIVAVADPDEAARTAAAAASGAIACHDPLAMLDEVALDAVVIAAPTTLHLPIVLAALARGVPALVEKPLAATPEDAARICAAADAAGIPVQVGHVERFNPAVLELGRRLEAGALSAVYAIASRRAGPCPARIRDVGVTVALATHAVDILSWVARDRPVRVYAETARRLHAEHEDLLFGLLHFPDGANGMVDVNWLTPAKRRQLVVLGDEGMFELDFLTQRLTFTEMPDTSHPSLIGGYAPTFEGRVEEIPVATHEPLGAELDAFLASVRTGSRPVVDVHDGRWAVSIAAALLESSQRHVPVEPS